ncbi:MAG: tRNA (adenosine(37)-N6)-threonylcarbamoyltransferase complex dimerization subunit type 1 TsaB [Oscillospiraceae bacterium]|nr:tRNA (adenosine(37)-N6)-threonylcarbamoyltransferase complex dimerization subunit type 1 TsaB [Oscillospiraceae bacterium]
MKILALESSAKAASVAYLKDGELMAQYYQASGLTHSRTLLSMTEDMLKSLDMKVTDMDGIAVAKGPGSFTGIRIGVAAAKGLAWGADKPICGVSTLEAMAHHCCDESFVICPVMDARRSEVYNGLFKYENGNIVRLTEDRAISLKELSEDAKNSEKLFFLVGDGAILCYNYFLDNGIDAVLAPGNVRLQSAWGVGKTAENCEFTDPGDLIPNYLRLSQAERERLEKQAK